MAEDNDEVSGNSGVVLSENALPTGATQDIMTATVTGPVNDLRNLGPNLHLNNHADHAESENCHKATGNDPDVSSLSASAFSLDGEYPFNTEFDPDLTSSTFDPFIGNQFNAFDMSEASWQELIDFNASV